MVSEMFSLNKHYCGCIYINIVNVASISQCIDHKFVSADKRFLIKSHAATVLTLWASSLIKNDRKLLRFEIFNCFA